jgi:rhodanese-related sulfurtransferase
MTPPELAAHLDAVVRLRNPKAYKARHKSNTIVSKRIPLDELRKQNARKNRNKSRKNKRAGGQ